MDLIPQSEGGAQRAQHLASHVLVLLRNSSWIHVRVCTGKTKQKCVLWPDRSPTSRYLEHWAGEWGHWRLSGYSLMDAGGVPSRTWTLFDGPHRAREELNTHTVKGLASCMLALFYVGYPYIEHILQMFNCILWLNLIKWEWPHHTNSHPFLNL